LFWIFSTFTFGYYIWAIRRSEGRPYREYWEDPSTGTGNTPEVVGEVLGQA